MKEKKNEFWKLDLLESKFTQATPRFSFTKKLANARNNSHVAKKLPATPNEAFQQIHALKADLFAKKYHGSYTRLQREVLKRVKQDLRTWSEQHLQLKTLFASPHFLAELLTSKLVKTVLSVLPKEAKLDPPAYLPEDMKTYMTDKSSPKNPSHFFITYCQNDKVVNGYISKLWNVAEIKKVLLESDWTFRKIRGNLSKDELANRTKETGKKAGEEGEGHSEESEESDEEMDAEEAFDKYAAYDELVGSSDGEFVADPNVDYNEITDEEDFLESDQEQEKETKREPKEKEKKEKKALPLLATGYFSGGSDDEDVDNDAVVKAATTVRKNRRGQRARQKIWEQKYGSLAAHVQKENQRVSSEREQRQKEFEERQRKREMKAKAADESGRYKDANAAPTSTHPSWEAKKKAEEKMKNAKFQGKKITFD